MTGKKKLNDQLKWLATRWDDTNTENDKKRWWDNTKK